MIRRELTRRRLLAGATSIAIGTTIPAAAQDDYDPLNRDWSSGNGGGGGGGFYSCWNCYPDPGFNLFCPQDTHCYQAEDDQSGTGIWCETQEPLLEGCHDCYTSGGACTMTVVHG